MKRLRPANAPGPHDVEALLEQATRQRVLAGDIANVKTIADLKAVLIKLVEPSVDLGDAIGRMAARKMRKGK